SLDGLTNGVAYKVVFLVMDKFQNASGTFFTSTVTPQPATDFWEDLHGRGSNVQGGLCTVTGAAGDQGALISMLGLIATMLYLVRRRRGARGLAGRALPVVALPLMILGAGRAHAGGGSGYQPYWEDGSQDNQQQATTNPADAISWHAGIRVGPYIPDIDGQ